MGMLGKDGGGLPPAWILGDQEAPACEKDMGTYVSAVYCPEQMERLNVDETGQTKKILGQDKSTWTPDYIMEQEEHNNEPATSNLSFKNTAESSSNTSKSS